MGEIGQREAGEGKWRASHKRPIHAISVNLPNLPHPQIMTEIGKWRRLKEIGGGRVSAQAVLVAGRPLAEVHPSVGRARQVSPLQSDPDAQCVPFP